MTLRAALLALLLSGCTHPRWDVELLSLDQVRDSTKCGADVLGNYGCWRTIDASGGCHIMAEDARDSDDRARLSTIGLEVWKCYHQNKEY